MVAGTEVQRRLEHFKQIAKEAGVKLTHQRLEIFKVVASSDEHPSAEAVHKAVQTDMPTVSLDTVYRTLWLLADLGLLTAVGPRYSAVRFDANVTDHHHYRCVRCGLLRDLESSEFNSLPIPDSVQRFGEVVSAHVEVRGVCARCAAVSAEPESTPSDATAKEAPGSE